MVRVPKNHKLLYRKAAWLTMLFFVCAILMPVITAAEESATSASAVISAYESTDNTIMKRKALRDVTAYTRTTGKTVAQWQKDILRNAISHKDPTVVESGLFQIGELKLGEFNSKMIALYHNATGAFANMYDNRVKIGVVTALSKTGKTDENVFNLFQEILDPAKSKFSYIQGDVLKSIKQLNDSKYLAMVEKYNKYMKDAIAMKKAAGENIMKYQVLMGYSEICEEIIQSHRR